MIWFPFTIAFLQAYHMQVVTYNPQMVLMPKIEKEPVLLITVVLGVLTACVYESYHEL